MLQDFGAAPNLASQHSCKPLAKVKNITEPVTLLISGSHTERISLYLIDTPRFPFQSQKLCPFLYTGNALNLCSASLDCAIDLH